MKTILVIDDDVINLMLVHEMLKSKYRLKVATKPERGLEIATSGVVPDLIMLDMTFEKYSGEDVYLTLQASVKTRCIPILFISNSTPDRNTVGNNWKIIRKPIDGKALHEAISIMLDQNRKINPP